MKFLEFASQPGATRTRETILWLHGGNVAGWMWGEQIPAFTDYRSITPTFPASVPATTNRGCRARLLGRAG